MGWVVLLVDSPKLEVSCVCWLVVLSFSTVNELVMAFSCLLSDSMVAWESRTLSLLLIHILKNLGTPVLLHTLSHCKISLVLLFPFLFCLYLQESSLAASG